MKIELKIQCFRSLVESILLYGAETWTMTVDNNKILCGVYTKLLRKALNVHWSSHTKNPDLYARADSHVCRSYL